MSARFEGLEQFFTQGSKELNDFILADGFEIGEIGKSGVRHKVETTPSARVPGKGNRVWTGHMRDRAGWSIQQTGNRIRVQYGWLNLRKAEDYIMDQENGTGNASGMPMAALQATGAWINVRNYLKERGYQVNG